MKSRIVENPTNAPKMRRWMSPIKVAHITTPERRRCPKTPYMQSTIAELDDVNVPKCFFDIDISRVIYSVL